MPTTTLTTEQAGEQITRDGHQWALDGGRIFYDFRDSMIIGTMPFGTGDFSRFSAPQIAATRMALMAWEDMANINFVENTPDTYSNSGWMLFGNYNTDSDPGRVAFAPYPDDTVEARFDFNAAGDVWINYSIAYNANPSVYSSYGYEVLLHEIGHALGLQHPGDYNAGNGADPQYDKDAVYVEDTKQYTVMSYFAETFTNADFLGYNLAAPMMDDIAAIQSIYGANTTAFSGSTIYGFNSNTERPWYKATTNDDALIFCIWDTGGTDTIDLSGYAFDQTLDLRDGRFSFSSVGGLTKNLSIYPGVVIENGIGGSLVDTIFGNDVGNNILGGAGNDLLYGYEGRDSLAGGSDADIVYGGEEDDLLDGDSGNDELNGEAGNDTLNGGAEDDVVNGGTGGDVLNGDDGADSLRGNESEDTVDGGAGNDNIFGDDDADLLNGGSENDYVSGGAGADSLNGDGGADSLVGGEDADIVYGGAENDTLMGNLGDDKLYGDAGNDVMDGAEGADTAEGGDGADDVNGREGNDSLLGDAGGDKLFGHDGADEIYGGLGADTINGGWTNKGVSYDAGGNDVLYGDAGDDLIQGSEGEDTLYGGADNDILNGGADNDRLDGEAGTDQLNGGAGDDTYVYRGDELMFEVLNAGTDVVEALANIGAGTITANIETFTIMVDTGLSVTGNVLGNAMTGGAGADTLAGGGGTDTLRGGGGADSLTGGVLADVMDGQEDGDTYDYDGTDTITDTGVLGVDLVNTSVSAVMGPGLNGIESLTATGGADINLTGDNAANTLTGNGGANTLDGLGGNDTLLGGVGNDSLMGAEGADQLRGDDGNDMIRGGEAGSATDLGDDIRGGTGNDTVFGALGGDSIYGEAGIDVISGDAGDDLIDGGANGDVDTLLGGVGNDSVYGGGGGDSIDGGSGNNQLSGGAGNDTVKLSGLGSSGADGGEGNDLLVVNFQSALTDLYYENYDGVRLRNADASYRVDYTGFERFDLTTGAGNDAILTGDGTDKVTTGAGNDTINTQAGTATVNGGNGDDRWLANFATATTGGTLNLNTAGTLFILGSSVTGIEALTLTTGGGQDEIITKNGQYNDAVSTNAGNDTVGVGGGFDYVDGGADSDRLIVNYAAATKAIGYQIYDGTRYYDPDNAFRVEFSGFEHFTITTGSGNDSLTTFDGDDVVVTGAGNDSIATGKGTAVVNGGAGTDFWSANFATATENAVLDLSLTTEQVFLGGSVQLIERIDLTTGGGDDVITTLTGLTNLLNDAVSTGAGNDRITVGGGVDGVDGGVGDDTLVVQFAASTEGVIYQNYDGTRYTNTSTSFRVNFAGVEHFDITTGAGADNISTFGGNDTVTTGAGNDLIFTGTGTAIVDGGEGVDLWNASYAGALVAGTLDLALTTVQALFSGSVTGIERLQLTTGAGNDRILTLAGATNLLDDVIVTGLGDDVVFVGGGNDVADGGTGGDDLLVIDYSSTATDIYYENYDGQRYRNLGLTYAANFANFERFDITTGSGNDMVQTFAGADRVWTGDGNDMINSGTGLADVNGGRGVDSWSADLGAFAAGGALDLSLKTAQSFLGSTVLGIEQISLATGAGADLISTLKGAAANLNDVVVSGEGDDTVAVGGGVDTYVGGAGTDLLIIDYGWTNQAIIHENYDGTRFRNEGATLAVNFSGVERFDIATGDGNDVILTGALDDKVATGAGNDVIDTQTGTAIVDGGLGIDRWLANLAAASKAIVLDLTVLGPQAVLGGTVRGIEALTITTGSGADRIVTGSAALGDIISAGAGNDTLTVAGGNDVVDGGVGIDTLVAKYGQVAADIYYENYDGTRFRTQDGSTAVNFAGIERFVITTGLGNDRIYAGTDRDVISTGDGNDEIDTRQGVAVVQGGGGTDWWKADFASSTLRAVLNLALTTRQAFLEGSVQSIERLSLTTGSGNDVIATRADLFLNDWVVTGSGNDVITLGGGVDNADGGAGVDTLILDFSAAATAVYFENYDGTRFRTADSAYHSNFTGIEQFVLKLGSGDDALATFDGSDAISGGAGADALTGGAGNDTLTGGTGKDTLQGGLGEDTLVFDTALRAANIDVVLGFDVVSDTIRLDDAIFAGLSLGKLAASALAVNITGLAETAADRIIYRSDNGWLLYDGDGLGGAAALQFATLDAGLALTNADFTVI